MKTLAIACALTLVAGVASAEAPDHLVRGYTKADGTYVAPHMQTNPNSTTHDNYSTVGNTNPYTGQLGTKPDTRPLGSTYVAPSYAPPRPAPSRYGSTYGQKPATCTSIYGC